MSEQSKTGQYVDYSPQEIEGLITQLANQGLSASQIGVALRDQYGIPHVKAITQKRVTQILTEKNLAGDIPEDLMNLIRKTVVLHKHMLANKKDMTSKRGYQLTVSKIRRRVHYYIQTNKLPAGWRYTPESAALLMK
ncbi:MAG: 30S ribosomal protein S15 [Candidatus Diapherotrites archaeon]|nr:30S ribosomal protein S15 [Candidatus Diapherotrites archaeon]MDZ4256178.1 30S ribosomal protein S15 [archaeon]